MRLTSEKEDCIGVVLVVPSMLLEDGGCKIVVPAEVALLLTVATIVVEKERREVGI